MGYFDFLIDKDNRKPKPGMEYIYRHNMAWKPGQLEHIPIKIGTIVIDVIQLENKSYEFTCKETGEKFKTNYGWSFAENTPKNVKLIKRLDKKFEKLKQFKKEISALSSKITTLKN